MSMPEKKPRGRPVGTVGTKISKLRRVANRLEQMARTQAMNLIQKSLDGEAVEKAQLDTAKWTVTTAKAFHQACLAEEESRRQVIDEAREEASIVEEEDKETGAAVFHLKMIAKEE